MTRIFGSLTLAVCQEHHQVLLAADAMKGAQQTPAICDRPRSTGIDRVQRESTAFHFSFEELGVSIHRRSVQRQLMLSRYYICVHMPDLECATGRRASQKEHRALQRFRETTRASHKPCILGNR